MATTGSRPVVLVVEDDAIPRLAAAFMLEDAGFEPIEAFDTDHAIKILESRNDIRLVFTDIDMPGSMDGMKLAAAVRDRWPPIKIIIASGHVVVAEAHIPAGGRFFSHTYTRRTVAQAFRKMIEGR